MISVKRKNQAYKLTMARKQYPTFAFLLLDIVLLVTLVDSNCPNNQICDCTSDYINCTCLKRESMIFEEETGEDQEAFSGKEFIVSGCGKIVLKKLSLKDVDIELVHLSDLLELQIESFVFHDGAIKNLHISNIEEFKLETQGFSNIKTITNLMIKNVTLHKLEPAIFTDTKISHLIVKDSRIGIIESPSLQLDNCESITIENNTIRAITAGAIRIKNVNKFGFIRNRVESIQTDSFSFSSVVEVNFGYCRFRQIASNMILAKQIDLFSFHHNYIRTCEDKAFWGIQPTKKVNFVDNQILVAKADSLIPNYGPNEHNSTIITNENNELGCDCNIEWLLSLNSEKYDIIKEKNVCHQPPHLKGLSLSLLKVYMDKDGNCSSVDILTTTEVPVTTTVTKTETEEKLTTEQSTTTSEEDEIDDFPASSNEEPTNDQQVSCHDKHKNNSRNMCLCNTILLFAFVIILIS